MSHPDSNSITTIHNFHFSIHDKASGEALRVYPARSLIEPYCKTVYVETPEAGSNGGDTSSEGQFSFRITPVHRIDFLRTLGYHFQTYFDGITDFASLNITANENPYGGLRDCITVKDVPPIVHHFAGGLPYPYAAVPLRCKHYKLRFLPIQWTEEEIWQQPGYFNPEDGHHGVGTIKFTIQEIESIKPSLYAGSGMNSRFDAQANLDQKVVYEKALKGKTLTHTIGASEDYKLTIPTTTLRLKPHVLGSITFHYRSRSTLQAMGIIPYDEPTFVADDFDLIPKMEDLNPFGYSIPSMPLDARMTQLTIREPPPPPPRTSSSRGWFSNLSLNPMNLSKMVIRTNPNRQRDDEYRRLNEQLGNIQIDTTRRQDDDTSNVILAARNEVPIEEFDRERRLQRKRRRAKRIMAKQQMGQRSVQIVDLTLD
ncbi:hypothetical protein BJ508DRAFT_417529 [Ascobolus immersus RN42]|uniref:DUF7918 domain-containing protein n=1 Tax=Ascobolus immersus RN42 TaxID=1160509 RepID=A0A3N4HXN6_ASCIM|nr:hypothetical protein BJ508DRAFT_417529 [Ascobolus immersus RN42]